jgi:hypothetical protein
MAVMATVVRTGFDRDVLTDHVVYGFDSSPSVYEFGQTMEALYDLFGAGALVGNVSWLSTQRRMADLRAGGSEASWQFIPSYPLAATEVPKVARVRMDSPLQLLVHIPEQYVAIGGVTGLLLLTRMLITFPFKVSSDIAKLHADTAKWKRRRSDEELRTLRNYAEAWELRQAGRLPPTIELLEGDPGYMPELPE